jgi:DNA-binding response OmpR family regulator
MKILVVEDENLLATEICNYFSHDTVSCEVAFDMKSALEKIDLYQYDCILLDIGLPDGDGLRVLEKIKKEGKADGVIIISAKNALDDKIKGIELGADDYLTKPFHLAELAVRVMAVVRRRNFGGNTSIQVGGINFSLGDNSVTYYGKPLSLTPTEHKIIHYFISSQNKVLSKTAIAEYVLGEQSDYVDGHQLVYTHIKNLKKKLMEVGCPDYIQNVYGTGYKFVIK